MQQQGHLPNTKPSRHADYSVCGQEVFLMYHHSLHNSLCNSEFNNHLLRYSDTSSLSRPEVMNLFLTVCPSPQETLAESKSEKELLDIVRSPDSDSRLFSTQIPAFIRCGNSSHCFVKNYKHLSTISNLAGNYYHVIYLSL